MTLSEEKSKAELSTFIESYWCFDGEGREEHVLFPDGTFNIFFASDSFIVGNNQAVYRSGMYLVPISSIPVRLFSRKPIYGIRFKAFSLHNLFKSNLRQLDLVNNMEALCAGEKNLRRFRSLFEGKNEVPEIIAALELVAFELLCKNLEVDRHLREKVNYILDQKGQVRVNDMAKIFGLSRQGLHKHFTCNLLVSPKELSAIWQLNHFFTISNEGEDSLTGYALDAGFYDQSHFNRSFRERFGTTPSQFIRNNHKAFVYARESMVRRFSNYYDPEV